MTGPKVIIEGDERVTRDLRSFGTKLAAEVELADRTIASQQAQDARSAAYGIGGVAAHVAPSIASHGDEASFGGAGWPMAMGAEFGRDAFAQFSPWTGSGESAGYFFVPAIKNSEADRAAKYEQALDSARGSL